MSRREAAVQALGTELLAQMGRGVVPSVFAAERWRERGMQQAVRHAMDHDGFRVALLRFVDVLPAIDDDARLVALADEYFSQHRDDLPPLLQRGMRILTRSGPLRRVAAHLARAQVAGLARQFIVGDCLSDAKAQLQSLWAGGCGCSVDLLGEETLSNAEAARYQRRYTTLIDDLAQATGEWDGAAPQTNVSVKLSALVPYLDAAAWEDGVARGAAALTPLLRRAKAVGAHLHIDMEHHAIKDLTLAAVMAALEAPEFVDGPSCGVVVQAYLKDAAQDLDNLLEWCAAQQRRLTIRLVRGAYWDQEVIAHRQAGWPVPVWQDKGETDQAYEALTWTLFANTERVTPAIATHNPRSVAVALSAAAAHGIEPGRYEFQVIYGMAEPLREALAARGETVVAYCPLGEPLPGMAYLVRRLLENTANHSMLRQMYQEGRGAAAVLAAPVVAASVPATLAPGFQNTPLTDFSQVAQRVAFLAALEQVRENLGDEIDAIIDGVPVATDKRIVSWDPAVDGRRVGTVAECGSDEVDQAVQVAARYWPTWLETPVSQRVAVLRRAAALLTEERHEHAALLLFEVGKGWRDADAEVAEAIDFFNYYADCMEALCDRQPPSFPGERNRCLWQPLGVAAVIAPWNFPIAISAGMVGAALVAGNAVVYKPSERAPVCGAALFDVLIRAGVPPSVLQFVPGGGLAGLALSAHPRVDLIAFTGSKAVRLALNRTAAEVQGRHVKRVIAEMGGKNAIIVDDSADLDAAVAGIVESATGYAGQKCSACSRVVVLAPLHDALVARLADALSSLAVGPPEQPANRMGPLIDARALASVTSFFRMGAEQGRVVPIRSVLPEAGCYLAPGLFTAVRPSHRLAREEAFGPLIAVLKAEDMRHAIAMANDSDYALTCGLFSRSPKAIARFEREARAGNLYINRAITGAMVGRQPFGGFRLSGLGSKAGGEDYVKQFMVPVSIAENTLRRGFSPE